MRPSRFFFRLAVFMLLAMPTLPCQTTASAPPIPRKKIQTAEEFEPVAVTLLHAAEAIRNQEEGKLECFDNDGKALAWVHLHTCGPDCNEHALADPPAIARFDSRREPSQSLRALSLSMIGQYRRLSTH